MAEQETQWFVYMIRRADGALYTGITTEPERRLQQHESGKGGARSLRGKGPLTLVWQQSVADRSVASKLEASIKKQTKTFKEKLVLDGLAMRLETSEL